MSSCTGGRGGGQRELEIKKMNITAFRLAQDGWGLAGRKTLIGHEEKKTKNEQHQLLARTSNKKLKKKNKLKISISELDFKIWCVGKV